MSIAYVFPGQGSQFVGMGMQYMSLRPIFRGTFDRANEALANEALANEALANEALGFDLKSLCLLGPEDELMDTVNTQPAIFTNSLAAFYMAEMSGEVEAPAFLAGHSLGELSAVCAAGAIEFEDGVKLARERGRLMKWAGEQQPGSMAAIIALDRELVQAACDEASAEAQANGLPIVVVANDNAPGQIVISGGKEAVTRAGEIAKAKGAKRILPLKVSIASHSPLMEIIRADFARAVEAMPVVTAHVPIVANTTVNPITHPDDIRAELQAQLTSPVRWTESVRWMNAQGVTNFLELGPKDVLSGLIKRILADVEGLQTDAIG